METMGAIMNSGVKTPLPIFQTVKEGKWKDETVKIQVILLEFEDKAVFQVLERRGVGSVLLVTIELPQAVQVPRDEFLVHAKLDIQVLSGERESMPQRVIATDLATQFYQSKRGANRKPLVIFFGLEKQPGKFFTGRDRLVHSLVREAVAEL